MHPISRVMLVLLVLALMSFLVPSTMVALGGLVPVRVGDTWRFAGVAMFKAAVKGYKRKWSGTRAHKIYLVALSPFIVALAIIRAALIVPLSLLSWVLFFAIWSWGKLLPVRVWLFRPLVGRIPEPRRMNVAETWNMLTSWSGSELYNQPISQDDYDTAEGSEGGEFSEVPMTPEDADITLDPGQSHQTSGEPIGDVHPVGENEGESGASTPTATPLNTSSHVGIRRMGRVLTKHSTFLDAVSKEMKK